MSVVKMVKRRRVILEALTDEPRKKSQWWSQKERVLREWLESSSSEFEEPGAVELVISQLNRGNKNPMLRLRCWKHIVIELVSLVDSDSEGATGKLQKYRYITGGNNAIGRRIRSAARRASYSTIDNTMPTTKSSSQYLPMDKNGAGAVEENAADLSFLKRQEQWLRRRKESLESKIVAVEANEDAGTFSPDVSRSRSSMKASQALAMEHRMKEMAVEAERVSRKERTEKEIRRARTKREKEERLKEKERKGSLIISNESQKSSEGSCSKAIVKCVGSRGLHIIPSSRTRCTLPSELRRHSTARGTVPHSRQKRRATVQANMTTSVVQAIDDDSGSSCYESEVAHPKNDGDVMAPHQESSTTIDDLAASNTSTDEEEAEATEKDDEDTFENGSFYTKNLQKKGHYQLRDSSQFMLTTMYKRKDRVTRKQGVSLLVGKLEIPPHEEKVITAIFDSEYFTEKEAAMWWQQNGHRFEDPKSLQQKHEMHRKQQQHKDAIQGLARRHTTAATAERLLQDSSIFSSGHQSGADMLAKEDKTSPALLEPPELVSS